MYLCKDCKQKNPVARPGSPVSCSPGTCTQCKKPRSTKPLFNLCLSCSTDPSNPRCERCGVSVNTAAGPKSTVVDGDGNVIGEQG